MRVEFFLRKSGKISHILNFFFVETSENISPFSKYYLLESKTNIAMLWINVLDKDGKTPPKVDSNEYPPKKHHTIPADILPSDSEDLLKNHNSGRF